MGKFEEICSRTCQIYKICFSFTTFGNHSLVMERDKNTLNHPFSLLFLFSLSRLSRTLSLATRPHHNLTATFITFVGSASKARHASSTPSLPAISSLPLPLSTKLSLKFDCFRLYLKRFRLYFDGFDGVPIRDKKVRREHENIVFFLSLCFVFVL